MSANTRIPVPSAADLVTVGMTSALVACVWWATERLDRPFDYVADDPAQTLEGAWYVGFLSTLGIIGWVVSMTACLIAAWVVLPRTGWPFGDTVFLLGGALLSGMFLADDWLQVHDHLVPRFTGLEDIVSSAIYGMTFLAWAWLSRNSLGSGRRAAFLLAAACFVGTQAMDSLEVHKIVGEEGLKLVGIALWARCLLGSATDRLAPAVATHARDAADQDQSPAARGPGLGTSAGVSTST